MSPECRWNDPQEISGDCRRRGLSPEERLPSSLLSVGATEASSQRPPRSPKTANPQTAFRAGSANLPPEATRSAFKLKDGFQMSLVRRLLLEFPDVRTTSCESTGISHRRRLDLRGDLSAGAPSPAAPHGFRPAPIGLSVSLFLCFSLCVSVSLSVCLSLSACLFCLSVSLPCTHRQTDTHTQRLFFSLLSALIVFCTCLSSPVG